MFVTARGRAFVDRLNLADLTIYHVIRVPVEICLLFLFLHKAIPEAMTFEGRNFDILSGISAPLIWYFTFKARKLNYRVLLAWNIICALLLINVVSNALLSLPDRFEQFGYETANVGLGYFPFLLLPAFLVPLTLFSNFAGIRKSFTRNDK